jgi:uncharacterized protein
MNPLSNPRRYNAYSSWCIANFGTRLQKVSIDAGFTCPNRDGTLGTGGCTFCNNDAFNPSYCHPSKSITQQITEGIEFHSWRYRRASKYIAYFQPYSNTYAPLERLQMLYEEALTHPGISGISIGTRPDCIDEEKLDYLQYLSDKYFVSIEYGIESCYNQTLQKINRGHTFEQTIEAIEQGRKRNLFTVGHLIFGLPGETREMILDEAKILSGLLINSLKFHQLQFLKYTQMAGDYEKYPEEFLAFTLEDYIEFVIDFLERVSPNITIERLAGEVPPRFLAKEGWDQTRYDAVQRMIEKRMEERDSWQGKFITD